MFYHEKNKHALDKSLFENPTSEYRGAPFWAWNGKLNKDILLMEIDRLQEMGMGGFHIHCRVGLDTEYLGEEFFEYVRLCNEKAKEKGMLCWLYDEDRWPSGSAGGMVTKDRNNRARFLVFEPEDYVYPEEGQVYMSAANAIRSNDRILLGRYGIVLDENGLLVSGARLKEDGSGTGGSGADEPGSGNIWRAYLEISGKTPWFNNQSYVNMLDKKAIGCFIQKTHEKYAERVGTDFGKSIPAIFTDEPQIVHKGRLEHPTDRRPVILPFTDDIEASFRAEYGLSLLDHIPEMIWELPGGKVSQIRYYYHRHVCERFSEAFGDQAGKWCDDHNLMLTGHMMSEWTLFSQTLTMGETMRPMKSFALPGIDMLCDRREFSTAKQAQSVANQFARAGVMSEIYGVTGWDFDFRGHKLAGDWQAALGVTVRVHHLTWMSMAGEGKRDYPACIGYQSPWYKEYPLIENHFARLNTALTRGKPHVRVGVIHPVESYWMYWGTRSQTSDIRMELENCFKNVIEWLLYGLIDFDFISEALLGSSNTESREARFAMGSMEYDAVLIPSCHTLRDTTMEKLRAFSEKGGKVIFSGNIPRYINAQPSDEIGKYAAQCTCIPFSSAAILNELEPYRDMDIFVRNADGEDDRALEHIESGVRASNLLYRMRDDNGCRWLFICHANRPQNESIPYTEELDIRIKGDWKPVLYDTMSGEITPIAADYENGYTRIIRYCSFHDSILLKLETGRTTGGTPAVYHRPAGREYLPQPFSFELSEPNALLLDMAEYKFDDETQWRREEEILRIDNLFREKLGYPLRMEALAQPWVTSEKPKTNMLHLRFMVESELEISGARFAMENISDCTISVNGREVDNRPTGWFVDHYIQSVEIPVLHGGMNEIIVSIPFGEKTNVEWCYLLGKFGVSVTGRKKRITVMPEELVYGDLTRQGLPFYTGNTTYKIRVACNAGRLHISLPHYKGALTKIRLDSREAGHIVFAPYCLDCGMVEAGEHIIEITVFGNRFNAFGALHNADLTELWHGPNIWRTSGAKWSYEYRLKESGILTGPEYWVEEN